MNPVPTATPSGVTLQTGPTLLWGRDALAAAAPSGTSWLWHGYLALGAVTLLTSQWKAGKTTLASILLSRMKNGGELTGLAVFRMPELLHSN